MFVFAHSGHSETAVESHSLYQTLTHQHVAVSFLIIIFVLASAYALLGLVRINWLTRLLLLVPIIIGLGVFYSQHQPAVSGVILSIGFILTFLVVFTMLGSGKH